MDSFSFCLYYTAHSYWSHRPEKVGLGLAATPGALVEQLMGEYHLPFVAYAVVSSDRNPNRRVCFTSCRCTELGFCYVIQQGW